MIGLLAHAIHSWRVKDVPSIIMKNFVSLVRFQPSPPLWGGSSVGRAKDELRQSIGQLWIVILRSLLRTECALPPFLLSFG